MDEYSYNQLVAQVFKKLVAASDEIDPDQLDCDATGDMVTLTASNGQKCIINTQRAVRQLWVAGLSQGIHFDWNEQKKQWLDDKGKGLELFDFVRSVVKDIAGVELSV